MIAKELAEVTLARLQTFNIRPVLPALRALNEGAMEDVLNINGCAYYQWTPGLIDILKPKQIVELGGAMGVWSIMACNSAYQDFKLHSITLPENGLEFAWVVDTYPQLNKIIGDDLDMKNWEGINLLDTDLWFFDSEHTPEQLQKEFDLYSPFFKKGTVVLVDDIRSFDLWPVWEKLPYDKIELTNPLHYSGYGLFIV